ncbi:MULTISPECIES: hypothetical protein [unclassified Meridianimarinicoccus]|uniref:hypothetical protein n=1 Tax=unclassified Meridianimarinicoccus TaxID=2923344 RepID=UPI001868D743|nr:hypothetical protein [Fluviibacterium sp. MJW13]
MSPSHPAAPPTLGWTLVLGIAAGMLVPILLTQALAPEAVMAAVGGTILGTVGSLVGSSRRSLAGAMVLVALMALDLMAPGAWNLLPVVLVLALAAGVETATTGGRSLTMSLFGAVMLSGAILRDGTPLGLAAAVFLASLLFGALLAVALKLHGRAALPANDVRGGIAHAVFLCTGLLLTHALVGNMGATLAMWTLQMFVMRAMAPPEMSLRRSLQYVCGAAIGAALASAWQFLHPMDAATLPRMLVAAACLMLGLRYTVSARVFSAAALTLAVLLASAASPGQALIRFEAAGLSALVALVLLLALQVLGSLLWPRRGSQGP